MPSDVYRFVAPSQMYSIASCRTWNLGDLPQDGKRVVLDLSRLRTVTPTTMVGLVVAVARWYGEGHPLTIHSPTNEYARRMMETIGFVEALETFVPVERGREADGPIRRLLPVINLRNFRISGDVEVLADELVEVFSAKNYTDGVLNQEAAGVIAEAASNVLYHARSASGGFALAQLRQRRTVSSGPSWWIEIAVGDAGQGIAASLGYDDPVSAVRDALDEGVTSTNDRTRGIGLHWIEEVVFRSKFRFLMVHSDHGLVVSVAGDREATHAENCFPGTLLTVAIPVGNP